MSAFPQTQLWSVKKICRKIRHSREQIALFSHFQTIYQTIYVCSSVNTNKMTTCALALKMKVRSKAEHR